MARSLRTRPVRPTDWAYAISPVDDSPIFYESTGVPTGLLGDLGTTPILLCDGIGCDGYVWRRLRPALTDCRVLHPHYRGHGRTAAPRDPTRVAIADLADDMVAVLDDARVDQAVLCGHSMGVQVALETWRRHPGRVAGLILICGAPGNPLRTFRGSAMLEDLLPLVQRWVHRVPGFINEVSKRLLPTRLAFEIATRLEIRGDLIREEDFMPYLEGMAQIDSRLFIAMLSAAGQHDASPWLGEIDVPCLVVAGERDGFTPPERSREMADAIPGAELFEVPDGSHTAPIERPNLVNFTVRDFLARRIAGLTSDVGRADATAHQL